MDGLHEDTGDGSMLCNDHPYKNNTPAGGICAFCLQEKLGKLVSSSFPIAVFPSSASSSPSFRSDIGGSTGTGGGGGGGTTTTTTITTTVVPPRLTNTTNRSRILYLLGQRKKKKSTIMVDGDRNNNRNKNLVFKRSKSTVNPRMRYMDADNDEGLGLNTPHKRGFWSFLYLQKHSHSNSNKTLRDISSNTLSASLARSRIERDIIVVEENASPCFDRKVSRSRSVGCGSRSFSGDFFERISTGFGDCTLRRVESQREGKPKVSSIRSGGQDCIQERVRCGGLFSGFMITSSSSSSSSSSNWVASNESSSGSNAAGKVTSAIAGHQHSRSRSWGWALASPMRAFSKQSSSKREVSKKNQNPNLAAIPSLLSVGS